MESLKQKLADWREAVERGIDQHLPAPATRPARLHAAIRYSMEAGGKRIRPALLLGAFEAFGGKGDPIPAAVAVECIHTYSLIHDDLPSIDNSDLRRGRASCHKAFSEATALLAGDALLTYAFQLLSRAYAAEPALAVALISDLSEASGSEQLIGGQMEDIENENAAIEPAILEYIHKNKTAALLTASLTMGLRFTGPDEADIAEIKSAGMHLGLAFQIIDDILDATQSAAVLGKPTGSDAAAGKSTYVALHGIDGARKAARDHTDAAAHCVTQIKGDSTHLLSLINELAQRIH